MPADTTGMPQPRAAYFPEEIVFATSTGASRTYWPARVLHSVVSDEAEKSRGIPATPDSLPLKPNKYKNVYLVEYLYSASKPVQIGM